MNRRPLVVFTICWLAGAIAVHLYGGFRLMIVLISLTLLLIAVGLVARLSGRALLIFGLALWIAAGYGMFRDADNVSVLPEHLGAPIEESYAGVRLEGQMTGSAKIDGDLAMFELKVERISSPSALSEDPIGLPLTEELFNPKNEATEPFIPLSRSETVVVRIKLAAEEEQGTAASWRRSDRLIVSGNLELPSEARNFGAFDYRSYLRNKRIHWVARAEGVLSVEKADAVGGGTHLLRRSDELRANLADTLAQLYPGIGAGYMQGLLLGLRDGLDPDTYTNFVRLGITHVLAISGMHVGLFVGGVLLLLRRSGLSKEFSLLAAICAVPPYVLLTGSSPSAVRAGIMSMIGLYAARRGWLKDGLHILCMAALLMLIWDPYYLTSISFQLSFAVTAGIILLTRPMGQILSFLPKSIAAAASVSLVADLVSFPLSIYYFNQYPLLGLAANLVLVPLISLVSIPLGTLSLIVGSFWIQGAEWIAYPVRLVNAAVFWCADSGSSIRWARTIWASPSPAWIFLYETVLIGGIFWLAAHRKAYPPASVSGWAQADEAYVPSPGVSDARTGSGGDTVPLEPNFRAAGLAAASAGFTASVRYGGYPDSLRSKLRPLLAAAAVVLLIVLIGSAYAPRPNPAGSVQMLDVGQGDSILITTPEGKNLLVDGGGTVTFERPGQEWRRRLDPYEVGRDVVVPLLKKRGVHRLDAVILTHGDRDHYGGLLAVLDEIPTDRFIMNGTRSGGEDLDELLAAALQFGAEIYAPQDGDVWNPDKRTSLEFLNPSGVFSGSLPELKEQNEYSVVFRLEMNDHSFLFTGDIGESAERGIIARLEERGENGRVDVLKVGHHGSKSSSSESWIKTWSPELSLISVGKNNTYGHPNAGIIERLEQVGSVIRRTDLDGEIQVLTPASEPLHIRTRLGREVEDAANDHGS